MVPEKYLSLLREFVAIKSISTNPKFKADCEKTATWLQDLLTEYGFKTEIIPGKKTNPVVFGEYIYDENAETILIYGHYDVQPAEAKDGWKSDPFEVVERDGRLYARGSIDNKGQVLVHIYTIGELIKAGKLKYNVKFLIEGNEETGNAEMADLVKSHKDRLSCDYVMISDGETVDDRATLDVSFRGGANLTVKYKTANNNLHSGIYGSAVPNAAHELAALVAKFYREDHSVAIPGFYEGADEVTEAELANNRSIPFDEGQLEKLTGAKKLTTEKDYDFYTQTGLRPMLTVSGFKSGYIDEGYSNIVPSSAEIRVNFRFVTAQDPEKVLKNFKKFVAENTADYVEHSVDVDISWKAIKLDVNQPKVQEIIALLEGVYGGKAVMKYVGGSIPVIVDFKEVLGKDTISVSMASEDCNMHGVDENFKVDLLEKGLEFSDKFFRKG